MSQPLGRLVNKVAVVTGGASGIGRAIANAYAREGARVVVADKTLQADSAMPKLDAPGALHETLSVPTNVCSPGSVDELVARTVKAHGRLDVAVNAAGIAPEIPTPQPIWNVSAATWTTTLGVNLTGVLNVCRAATAQMMTQPALPSGDRGWVVNISSIYGQTAKAGNDGVVVKAAYCASKHAVLGLTKAAALDCAPYNIRVNAICPGFTSTSLTSSLIASGPQIQRQMEKEQPLKGIGCASDVARLAVVLGGEDASWVTGAGKRDIGACRWPLAHGVETPFSLGLPRGLISCRANPFIDTWLADLARACNEPM